MVCAMGGLPKCPKFTCSGHTFLRRMVTMGFDVVQFKAFRGDLFVFGESRIKKVSPEITAGFVQEPVTNNIGCVATLATKMQTGCRNQHVSPPSVTSFYCAMYTAHGGT